MSKSSQPQHAPLALRLPLAEMWLIVVLLVFLAFGAYQLQLPGLHYDEAKEAGVNAMQLLRGLPVTAFRGVTIAIGSWHVPLMVQDYIGALNVLLAMPFLAVGGINPVALRWLPLVTSALTLVCMWRVARRLGGSGFAAGLAALLLAVNPSFVFWSRQGIFVTNLTALLFMASLLTGLHWWQGGRRRDFYLTAFLCGLGIYAKLLFVWAIGAMLGVALIAWTLKWAAARGAGERAAAAGRGVETARLRVLRSPSTMGVALVCFLLPLAPLILFNLRTGGTLTSVFGNLDRSYYGVDNSAYLANLAQRVEQIGTLLRGDHFWYLGEAYGNGWAAWLFGALVVLGMIGWLLRRPASWRRPPAFLLPLGLLCLMVAQSAFTVSDLFITHYALLLPLIPLAAGLAFGAAWGAFRFRSGARHGESPMPPRRDAPASDSHCEEGRSPAKQSPLRFALSALALVALLAWAGSDAWNTVRYHRVLSISGGYAAHSDASARLAAYLDEKGYASPVLLDWGLDAPLSFLTAGRVNPIEVFGYERLDAPDAGFAGRVKSFLADSNTVYVGPPPENAAYMPAVFRGRVEAMTELAAQQGWVWLQEAWFSQRSGDVLFVIYRAIPQTQR